ncbi:MAG TPA: phosphoribosylglycinamide formyltransferase [Methylomirabilota bacterium]|nr:phosphoribosylglycinamide formyltransferase [Methylomirabilota bacterium]
MKTSAHGTTPTRLAVLLSGTGRSLANLLRVIEAGELDAAVVAVVSSVAGVRGLEIAEAAGVPSTVVPRRGFSSDAAYSEAIFTWLEPRRPELIVLAGFLRKLVAPPAWEGRILNIHPSLLPETAHYAAGRGLYGERVHAAVLAHGDTTSGATVHVVDNGYDTGPVVLRAEAPVLPGDTPASLGTRVFAIECRLYPEAIRRHLSRGTKGASQGDEGGTSTPRPPRPPQSST